MSNSGIARLTKEWLTDCKDLVDEHSVLPLGDNHGQLLLNIALTRTCGKVERWWWVAV